MPQWTRDTLLQLDFLLFGFLIWVNVLGCILKTSPHKKVYIVHPGSGSWVVGKQDTNLLKSLPFINII